MNGNGVAGRARDYYAKQAKERMKEGQKHGGKARHGSSPENLPDCSDARDAAGKAVPATADGWKRRLPLALAPDARKDRLTPARDADLSFLGIPTKAS